MYRTSANNTKAARSCRESGQLEEAIMARRKHKTRKARR
jgi:hypothetical protein